MLHFEGYGKGSLLEQLYEPLQSLKLFLHPTYDITYDPYVHYVLSRWEHGRPPTTSGRGIMT